MGPIETPLLTPQPGGVQADPLCQRFHPPSPGPITTLHSDGDHAGPQVDTRQSPTGCRGDGCPTLARRDQRLDLGQLDCCSLPRRPVWVDAAIGMTKPAPHCNPTSRPAHSVFGRSAQLPSLAASECNPRAAGLNRGLPVLPTCQRFTASNARAPRLWVSCAGTCSRTQDLRKADANDCAASVVNPCVCSTAVNAVRRAFRSSGVRRGNRRADSHPGSDFTARLRARNSLSTALYTRVPVNNRVRMYLRWDGSGRNGHDRTCVGRPSDAYAHAAYARRSRLPSGGVSVRCDTDEASARHRRRGPTDNPDLSPRSPQHVGAARASGVRDQIPTTVVHRRDAHFCEHTIGTVRADLDVELVEFDGEADHVRLLVAYRPSRDLHTGASAETSHRPHRAPRIPAAASLPACADTSGRRPT
jgi:hypothetical protein